MKQFLVVVCLGFPALAPAQSGEAWFTAGASILSNRGIGTLSATGGSKDDVQLTDGFRFGFRFTINNDRIFGHEFGYAYNRTKLRFSNPPTEQGMAIHQGGYNFLIYANKDSAKIRPFATGGGHFSNYVPPGSSATQGGGSTKFGLNYGAGVKAKFGSKWAVRFDLREYHTRKPFDLPLKGGWLNQTEASAGFGVVF